MKTEIAVLNCLISYEESQLDIDLVREEDFTSNVNKEIFKTIKELENKNEVIDLLTVQNKLDKSIPASYLAEISTSFAIESNFNTYVAELKDKTLKRQMKDLAIQIAQSEKTGKEISEFAEKMIFKINENRETTEFQNIGEMMLKTYDYLEAIERGDINRGLKTGFNSLDNLLGGLNKGDLIILAARPSMGKTALALNIALNIMKQKKEDKLNNVAFFSLEMTDIQLGQRLITRQSRTDTRNIKDWKSVISATGLLSNLGMEVDYTTNNVPEIKSKCRKLKRQKGLDLIIIDYIQLMEGSRTESRQQEVSEISRELKKMAKELDCPVIALSQLSRACESRADHRPILSDLRESGSIEQDADVVMFIYRDSYYHEDTDMGNTAEIIVSKNRNGEVGISHLSWVPRYISFENIGGR